MNSTSFPLKAWAILLAIHPFCQADPFLGEPVLNRVILVPPEKLEFSVPARVGYESNPFAVPDPFAEPGNPYVGPARPLRERIQDQIGVKIPPDSTIFYDIDSRALSVSSTKSVIDAISDLFKSPGRPNVTIEVITHETQSHESSDDGGLDGPFAKPPSIISRDRFQVFSSGTGSLKINAPESIAKSGQLEFRIVPTVNTEIDFVFAEISLVGHTDSKVAKDSPVQPNHFKTTISLRFNTTTTVYESRLPSGSNFGISVRLTFQFESPGQMLQPEASPPAAVAPSPR